MAMQSLENKLRETGDPRDLERANTVASWLKERGSDIPFSSVAVEKPVTQTPETPVEIKRFSQETREALEKQGFVIYGLTGQSIKTLRDAGRKFWSTWHNELPDFEALGSMHSEVAINPNKPFLPESNNKTLAQQEEMVGKFSEELGEEIPGVKAIIGQAPDYVELAFAHFDATEGYLFGAKNNYNYTRTKTPTSGSIVALVGRFGAVSGLDVNRWDADDGHVVVHAAPLVVPV